MTVMRFIAPAVIFAAIATPVSADVTLHLKRTNSDVRGSVIDSTEYRKGAKVRTDSSGSSIASVSMIVDAGTGRVIMLTHDAKTAEVLTPGKTRHCGKTASPRSSTRSHQRSSRVKSLGGRALCTTLRRHSSTQG